MTALRRRAMDTLGPEGVRRARRLYRPAPRGLLWRRRPVSQNWGFDRGTPVDRFFIEAFLSANAQAIRGRVLEVKDDEYSKRYGRNVTVVDVLDVDAANNRATVIADLAHAPQIAADSYDCIILTQVLHLIFDMSAAVRECHRILRVGGTLLATLPAASRTSREHQHSDYWRVTPAGADRLVGDVFGSDQCDITGHGNAALTAAFLMGVSAEEVPARLLSDVDSVFPLVVTVRATKR